jgi:dephospho-CoA kinase
MKIVVVNGKPKAGKSTFETFCQMYKGAKRCRMRSTVDQVKLAARQLYWDGEKTPEARKFLSDLKDAWTTFNDGPFKDIEKYIEDWTAEMEYSNMGTDDCVLFVDAREPEEIDKLKNRLGACTLLIERPQQVEEKVLNHADEKVNEYNYDYYIKNDGTFEDLENAARDFLKLLFEEDCDII